MLKVLFTIASTISSLGAQLLTPSAPLPVIAAPMNVDGYCYYAVAWNGPGWYLCGDELSPGQGYGGPASWKVLAHRHPVVKPHHH